MSAFKSKVGMSVLSRFFIFLAAVSLFFSLIAITGADEKPEAKEPEHKISVKTELMEVRAVVTDRSGKIIEGLKKEDFELLENDKPQEISFFSVSEVKVPAPAKTPVEKQGESKPSTPAPVETEAPGVAEQLRQPPARTTLLFVDTLHMSFTNLVRVKEAMRHFVKERLTDQDMVAVATSGQTLGIGQQFSRNRQLLNNSIERIRPERSPDMTLTPTLAEEVLAEHLEPTRLAIDLMRRETGSCDCTILRIAAQNKARQVLFETASLRKAALFTLEKLAEQMMTLPGKRMIAIFSDGFDLHNIDVAVQSDELNSLISRANRSGVVIYSIDSKGLKVPAIVDGSMSYIPGSGLGNYIKRPDGTTGTMSPLCPIPEPGSQFDTRCFNPSIDIFSRLVNKDEIESLNGLSAIAQQTGGKLLSNTNDLYGALGEAIDANRFYYVLSYYLTPGNDKRFRTIKVQVKNHPEYKIVTPKGFIPSDINSKKEDLAAMTPQKRLLYSMGMPLPKTDIGVSALADYLETEKDDKQVSLTVYFDGDSLQYREKDGNKTVQLEVIFAIYDSNGKQVDAASVQAEGNFNEAGIERAKKSGYRFSRRASLEAGLYEVRVGVREQDTNRIGTAITWVEVPAANQKQLGVSSLLLGNPLDSDQDASEGMKVSKLEQVQMVQNIPLYKRDDYCDYSFRLRRGDQMDKNVDVAWMSELVRDGKTIKQESWKSIGADTEKDSKGWFDLDGELDLKGFDPGVYELRVSVKEGNSKKLVQRDVVFGIE